MKFVKDMLVEANSGFGGTLVREGSLDYALAMQKHKRYGDYRKLAFIWRAILVDHPFSDGNKRTALWAALKFAGATGRKADSDTLTKSIVKISAGNVTSIDKIERMLRNGIR